MFKRVGLFLLTNVMIMTTIAIITNVLGINHYITARGINYESLLIFSLLWGMIGAFISLLLSKPIAKWSMGVKIIKATSSTGTERELLMMVQTLSQRAGIPMPEVGIYNSPEINAFATGATKSSSLVAVSSGLLNQMERGQIEGVLGHEISHIANGDMVTLTLIQGAVNSFALFFSRIISFTLSQFVDDDIAHMFRFIITIVLDIAFTILGSVVVAWFSRKREFKADIGGATYAGREKMISALEALRRGSKVTDERGASLASLKISNNKTSLFSTHPPLDDRIRALKSSF